MSESGDGTRGPGPHGFPFALDPATLQQMMQNLPPEVLNMMGPIQAAMSSEDPMAALEKLRDAGVLPKGPDAEAMRQQLSGMMDQFSGEVGGLQDALKNLGPMLGRLEGLQEQLGTFQKQLKLTNEDESLLNQVFGELNGMNPGPHLQGLLEESGTFTGKLRDFLGDLQQDPLSQIQTFGVLQQSLSAMKDRISQGADSHERFKSLVPLLRRTAELSIKKQHPLAAEFLARCLAVEEALAMADGSYAWGTFKPRWEKALEEAERTDNIQVARLVAIAMQLGASRAQDFGLVAELASRVASLAEAAGDQRTSILSRTEEALAYARNGIPEAGKAIAQQAISQAETFGVDELKARAKVTLGQVLQMAGETQAAQDYLQALAEELKGTKELYPFLGRTLLALAKAYPDGAPLDLLREAQLIGFQTRDLVVFVPITLGLADRLASESKTREALSVLVKGRVQAVALAGKQAGAPFDQLAKQFEENWGQDLFRDALQAFKEANLSKS